MGRNYSDRMTGAARTPKELARRDFEREHDKRYGGGEHHPTRKEQKRRWEDQQPNPRRVRNSLQP